MASIAETFALAIDSHRAGNWPRAEQICRQILQAEPLHADSLNLLGVIAYQMRRFDQAILLTSQAIKHQPQVAVYHYNLGLAQEALGRIEQAQASFQAAIRLQPNLAEAHNNLGFLLYHQGRLPEAVVHFQKALNFRPDSAEAHNNLGLAYIRQGELEQAFRHCRRAIEIWPDFAAAHNNLGGVFIFQGWLDQALASFHRALRIDPTLTEVQHSLFKCMNYDAMADPDAIFAAHCSWGKRHQPATPPRPHDNDPAPDRRLRIGYVSPDLCFHPLTRYLEPVLANHDQQQVEVFCYAEELIKDDVTARLQKSASAWRLTNRLSDAQTCDLIRADRIDILIDLAGHTANNRLCVFAHKPAPIQATWLGYLNTTGLKAMDYRITDAVLDPPGQPVRDIEELVRLPGGMCCFAPPADAPEITALPALTKGHLTFGSLHRLIKLNATVFDLWSRVLQAVPTARLLMFHNNLVGVARDRVEREFTQRGVASEQLDLRKGSNSPGYLGIYGEIDVTLDAFPWTGGVTTCESLWMGVPVLTLAGGRPANRNSAALLARVGLTEWVTQTPKEFVEAAVRLSGDLDKVAALRAGLRDRMTSALCDGKRFTRELEAAYRAMWRRWCESQKDRRLTTV